MAETRRTILKIMWHHELGPKMEEARSLLDASIVREGAMLTQLSDIVPMRPTRRIGAIARPPV
jgi:hypothetical protein